VELYLHSPNTPSWCGAQFKKKSTETTLPLPLFFVKVTKRGNCYTKILEWKYIHWNVCSQHDSLCSIRLNLVEIMTLWTIIFTSRSKEINEATGTKNRLETSETVLIIILETKILNRLNTVSKVLRSKSMDLKIASYLLWKSSDSFMTLRNCFDQIKTRAVEM